MSDNKGLLSKFRLISWVEGISYLSLIFIAMPLKYMMDEPMAVKVVGMAHGVLFVAYIGMCFYLKEIKQFNKSQMIRSIVASMLPFGMIYVDKKVLEL